MKRVTKGNAALKEIAVVNDRRQQGNDGSQRKEKRKGRRQLD